MSAKAKEKDSDINYSDINKKILEIKKKIQLSEGQRKALFEETEAERKANADEIVKLKKENSQLITSLKRCKSATAKLEIPFKRIETIIGSLEEKSTNDVLELLQLQIIDRSKQHDLLKYKIKKKEKLLANLGKEYQILLSEKAKKEVTAKVDAPIKKETIELHNNIHVVEVQLNEANHIRRQYKKIIRELRDDAAKFESTIKNIEKELVDQKTDIQKLEQVMTEAVKMRNMARMILLKEERLAISSANARHRQALEGRKLVNARKKELDFLERRVFQSGKIAIRPEPEGAEDGIPEDDVSSSAPTPAVDINQAFDVLKAATGALSPQETLEKFNAQKETTTRLVALRKKGEIEKAELEEIFNKKNVLFETLKYSETKDSQRKCIEIEDIQKTIEEHKVKSQEYTKAKQKAQTSIKHISKDLQGLYANINPEGIAAKDAVNMLQNIKEQLIGLMAQLKELEKEEILPEIEIKETLDVTDEKWLPNPYSGLIRRTPLPPPSATSPAPPPTQISDEEEEVPSRGYLKRQAQLVVDAKLRRKNMRMQVPKKF